MLWFVKLITLFKTNIELLRNILRHVINMDGIISIQNPEGKNQIYTNLYCYVGLLTPKKSLRKSANGHRQFMIMH